MYILLEKSQSLSNSSSIIIIINCQLDEFFPGSGKTEVPFMKWGCYEGCQNGELYFNRANTTSNYDCSKPLVQLALVQAIKICFVNPLLYYVFLLMVLDLSFSTLEVLLTWKFLLSYLLILLFVPTAVWFWIIRKELAIEHSFANCLFQVYDSKLEAFTDKRRYQILSGDLLLLSMNELIPTDVVFLTSLDHNNLYSVATQNSEYRVLIPSLAEGQLTQLNGRIEYSGLPFFEQSHHITLVIDSLSYIINPEDVCHEGAYQTTVMPIREQAKYSFRYRETINPIKAQSILIVISIMLTLVLSIAGSIWVSIKRSQHRYLENNEITNNYNFVSLFVEHLVIYSSIIPVFVEVIRPFFAIVGYYKINNDPAMVGTFKRNKNSIVSILSLDNLSMTKFVNYSLENTLNNEKMYASGFLMFTNKNKVIEENNIEKQAIFEEQTVDSIYFSENPIFQTSVDKARLLYTLERMLLGVGYGELSDLDLAINDYCKGVSMYSYCYNNDKRTILLPKGLLKSYTTLLMVNNSDWQGYLYQMPREEEQENEDSDEDEEIKKIYEKVQREKDIQQKRNVQQYVWVIMADLNCPFVRDNHLIQSAISKNSDFNGDCKFVFEHVFYKEEFMNLQKSLGKQAFKKKNIQLPQGVYEDIITQMTKIGAFTFKKKQSHDMHLLLDLNLAEIRQWIFTDNNIIENDTTLQYFRKYFEYIEYSLNDDLDQFVSQMINLKSQPIATQNQKNSRNFKIQNSCYKIGEKYISLVVTQNIAQQSLGNVACRQHFLESLLIPSFVVFIGLSETNIREITKFQSQQAGHEQTIVVFSAQDDGLNLCQENTLRVTLINSHESKYKSLSHIQLATPYCLSKILLTHSRQTHIRLASYVLFSIYKSLLITMCEFFFSFYNGYSPNALFTDGFHFMFQALFTTVYGFFLFTFYSDVNHGEIAKNAQQFSKCLNGEFYSLKKLGLIFFDCLYQGFIISYLPANILQYANDKSGVIEGYYYISLVSFLTLYLTVALQPYIYFATIAKPQFQTFIINTTVSILILMTTCSSSNVYTNIPQYVNHIGAVLDNIKSIFLIIFLTAICLTPTMIINEYNSIVDLGLGNMIYTVKEKEELTPKEEKKPKEEENDNEKEVVSNDLSSADMLNEKKVNESHVDQPLNQK